MSLIDKAIVRLFPNVNLDDVNVTFELFDISTIEQQAAFIAQCAHESGNFKRVVENLNYSAQGLCNTWPSRFKDKATGKPNAKAIAIARKPQQIANAVYNGRLGNASEGNDGWNYRGRGYIQLTGKANYRDIGNHLANKSITDNPNIFVEDPDLVATQYYAWLAAGGFWDKNRLNQYANDFVTLTKKINGGTIGLQERIAIRDKILSILEY